MLERSRPIVPQHPWWRFPSLPALPPLEQEQKESSAEAVSCVAFVEPRVLAAQVRQFVAEVALLRLLVEEPPLLEAVLVV